MCAKLKLIFELCKREPLKFLSCFLLWHRGVTIVSFSCCMVGKIGRNVAKRALIIVKVNVSINVKKGQLLSFYLGYAEKLTYICRTSCVVEAE